MYDNRKQYDAKPNHQFKPFFNHDGSLVLDWVGEKAEKASSRIAEGKDGLSVTGLRNFYNEFLRIKNMPAGREQEKIVMIKLLVAKVQYKKITGKVPNIFAKFISELVDEIGTDLNRFENACLIMEAIVGYNPKKK